MKPAPASVTRRYAFGAGPVKGGRGRHMGAGGGAGAAGLGGRGCRKEERRRARLQGRRGAPERPLPGGDQSEEISSPSWVRDRRVGTDWLGRAQGCKNLPHGDGSPTAPTTLSRPPHRGRANTSIANGWALRRSTFTASDPLSFAALRRKMTAAHDRAAKARER
jgi:hypothetical protein